LLSKSRIV